MWSLKVLKEDFVFFRKGEEIIFKKNNFYTFIIDNYTKEGLEKNLEKIIKINNILTGNFNFIEKPLKDNKKDVWHYSNYGLIYPWVWLKENAIFVTLPTEYLFLKDLIIEFSSKYCQNYDLKSFENSETKILYLPFKEDIELPKILQHHHLCPYSIGLNNLLKTFL